MVEHTSSMPTNLTPFLTSFLSSSQPHFGMPQIRCGSPGVGPGGTSTSISSTSILSSSTAVEALMTGVDFADDLRPSSSLVSSAEISMALGTLLKRSEVALTLRLRPSLAEPASSSASRLSFISLIGADEKAASDDRQRSMAMGMRCVGLTGVGGADIGCMPLS